MGNKLYVGNLDYQITADDLRDLFAGAGQVMSAQIILDRDTRRSKGFAFVEMANDEEARRAIALYNGHMLNERALSVSEAHSRDNQPGAGRAGHSPNTTARPRFREIKHKSRGGANRRRF